MSDLISVIIPFYNSELFLEKCIISVKNQKYSHFECILVDDGSTDASFEIAQNLIQNDTRFRLIQQKNQGQGVARNTALNLVQGEFITFLDSDDWYDVYYLEKMYQICAEQNADIVSCALKMVDDNRVKKFDYIHQIGVYTHPKEIQKYLIEHSAINKIFRRKLFEKIRFAEQRSVEDLATIYKLTPFVQKLIVTNDELYNYRLRSNSTEAVFTKQKQEELLRTWKQINADLGYDFLSKREISFRLIRKICQSKVLFFSQKKQIENELLSFWEIIKEIPNVNYWWQLKLIVLYVYLPSKVFYWYCTKFSKSYTYLFSR